MNAYSRVKACIDLDAVLFNMEQMRKKLPDDTKMFAVIKTDGYGHGAVELGKILEPLDYLFGFCVATVEEGVELRRANIQKPILILGYTFKEQYEEIITNHLRPAVFSLEMASHFSAIAQKLNMDCNIHIKIDTGMSRVGYQVNKKTAEEIAQISKLPNIVMEGIFTHFARADEADKSSMNRQYDLFLHMIELCEENGVKFKIKHCANSATIVEKPEFHLDAVRAGITLYGLWPSDEVERSQIQLHPVMELKSHVAHIKLLEAGREISYGGTYRTSKDTLVATIPVGYGDGYPRSLSNKGYVLIHGKKAPILGRVCMDQFMVDISSIDGVEIGTEVTLLGKDNDAGITMEELGVISGRFNYELACDINRRVPREYILNGQRIATRHFL